jgi:hypothetical protein
MRERLVCKGDAEQALRQCAEAIHRCINREKLGCRSLVSLDAR